MICENQRKIKKIKMAKRWTHEEDESITAFSHARGFTGVLRKWA